MPPAIDIGAEISRSLSEVIGRTVTPAEHGESLCALGLDSLGTLRWGRRLSADLGTDVPLTLLMGRQSVTQTIDAVTQALGAQRQRPENAPGLEDVPSPEDAQVSRVEQVAPAPVESTELTVVQQAYWTGRGGDYPGGDVATFWYHEYDRDERHRGRRGVEEDLDRIEIAFKRVLAHHPMLRTVIGRDGRPKIAKHDVRHWSIPLHDLRGVPPTEAEREAELLRHELSHQVRPTDQWPIIDLQVILLPGKRLRLCIGFDALLVDFASWGLVMEQWQHLVVRPRSQLEPPTDSFAEALRERAGDPDRVHRRARDRQWWNGQQLPAAPLGQANRGQRETRFARHRTTIDTATWSAITTEATRRGLSASSVVLTAFAIACQRWGTGVAELTLNLTVFDRPEEHQDVVGDFSGTTLLPLTEASGFVPQHPRSFVELAEAVNRRFWECLEHRSYGGVEVARDRPDKGPWPVVFTSGLGQEAGTAHQWLGEVVFGVSQTPQVLWDHLVWEEDHTLVLTHDVVQDCLPKDTVDGVIAMQAALLQSLADSSGWDRPAPGWDPTAETPQQAHRHRDAGPLLHDLWREHLRFGQVDRPAIFAQQGIAEDSPQRQSPIVSHRELFEQATIVAEDLRRSGIRPAELVLVAHPKGVTQIAAVLGVLLAGAGYVPADPGWPSNRLQAIRRRTGLRLALAQDGVTLPEGVQRVGVPRVGVQRVGGPTGDAGSDAVADSLRDSQPDLRIDHEADAADLAYVIFTSGSTGEPKGVAIEHRQARTTIDEVNHRFGLGADDRVLAVSALSFDLSVHDLFGVLGLGGAVVLPDAQRLRDPQHWLELMGEHHVTVWNSAPPLMEMLLEYAESVPDLARKAFSSLRHCLLSGDWIPVTLPERLRALAPHVQVHSLGGATEASIWSITHSIGEVDPQWTSIPYGRALPGQSFWILNEHGHPVVVGEVGELQIGGEGVARGYIGAPELTAERFIERADLATRLYRTGDLGRWRSDGTIEFLGRLDRQVKVGGHRIELGEVEAALLRLPQVRQAVASSLPGPDGRPRLVAHVSAPGRQWADLDPAEQRRIGRELATGLAEQVPAYLVPSRFVVMGELPTTENGKVDHKALPNPYARKPPNGRGDASATSQGATGAERSSGSAAKKDRRESLVDQECAVDARPAAVSSKQVDRSEQATSPTFDQPATESARSSVLTILGPTVSTESSFAANGSSSLELVQVANRVEDLGLPRPTIGDLLAAERIADLMTAWDSQLAERRAAGTASGLEESVDVSQGPATAMTTASAAVAAVEKGVESAAVTLGVGPSSLADRLRRAADLLDQAAAEIGRVTGALQIAPASLSQEESSFDLTEMQLAYLVGRARDHHGRELAPHFYTEALVSDLDSARLEQAWRRIVERHPMLRAVITEDTRQRSEARGFAEVQVLDQRELTAQQQEHQRRRIRTERASRQLPVDRAPLIRLLVVQLGGGRARLHLDLDLVFHDAESAVDIVEELANYYRDPASLLPQPAAQFRAWADQQAPSDAAARYWSQRVKGLPDPIRPEQVSQLAPVNGQFVRRRFTLDAESWQALRRVAAARQVTVASLLLTELGSVLSPDREGVAMLTLSRRPVDHQGVVGDYTATMPVVLGGQLGSAPMQRRLAEGLEHSLPTGGLHGNAILRLLRAAGRSAQIPVAISLSLKPAQTDASQLLDVFGRTEYAISQTPQVLLDIQLFEVTGELRCNLDADEALLDPKWLGRLHQNWQQRLVELAALVEPIAQADATASELVDGSVPAVSAGASERAVADVVRQDIEDVFRGLVGATELDSRRTWFEQGVTSLGLVTAHRELRSRGYRLDITDLFNHPSVAALEASLRQLPGHGRTASDPSMGSVHHRLQRQAPETPRDVAPARSDVWTGETSSERSPLIEAARGRGSRRRAAR